MLSARAGLPLRYDRGRAGEAAATTEFADSLEQMVAERGQPLPRGILGSVVMLARMVGWLPLKRGPKPDIQVLERASEKVKAMRLLL